ncbi:hypothetical protein FIV42_09965 [Persicimonas caeni]|uniref:Uncharacterized protein n=1 Tax=Persicimonas caeni TaxID=2292766 RepID=A0A4Y6PRU8_PERCE|nr:hypothetical protein [Persicimonas caeni]QDG51046.1 hypothetical protein FIV42_09965 [Persicimonas caeni]QED32267.1 hypothetical protein FRD00_09960 [Persicimonas caeni]
MMRARRHQKIRNPRRLDLVYLLACLLVGPWLTGCATTPQTTAQTGEAETTAQTTPATPAPEGPFEAAQTWASEFSADTAPEAVREVVGDWKRARVARVWASGEEYRAVVVQKSTARETPAVLLRITRGDAKRWEVTGVEPTTSTNLWSEL